MVKLKQPTMILYRGIFAQPIRLIPFIKTKEITVPMRTMKQVLEETIDFLNNNNFEYLFGFRDIQLPLPTSAKEIHYEVYITRTKRESNKRELLFSWRYSCHPDKRAEHSEKMCERMVFDLLGGLLYHHDPTYQPPKY